MQVKLKRATIKALKTIYGIELMEDNVALCRERLAGPDPTPAILAIVKSNIKQGNALELVNKLF